MTVLAVMTVVLGAAAQDSRNKAPESKSEQYDATSGLLYQLDTEASEAIILDWASMVPGQVYQQSALTVPAYFEFKSLGISMGGDSQSSNKAYVVEIGEKGFYGAKASSVEFADGSRVSIIRKQGLANMPNMAGTLTLPASLTTLETSSVLLPGITKLVFLGTVPPDCLLDGGYNPWTADGVATPADIEVIVPVGSLDAYKNKAGLGNYFTNIHTLSTKYMITFYDEDGVTVLDSREWESGETPSCTTPTKTADAQYTYTFAGWDKTVVAVTEAASYKATYTQTVNKYTVTFYDEDGVSVLDSREWEYGATPSCTNPTKTASAQYTYNFAGWDKTVVAVTGTTSYKATYTQTVNKYTVTFYDEDGVSVLDSREWEYGATPSCTDPTKAEDENYTYTFAGWDKALSAVTGDAAYKAVYNATPKTATSAEAPVAEGQKTQKVMDNGVLYIIRGGVRYDARGRIVAQ